MDLLELTPVSLTVIALACVIIVMMISEYNNIIQMNIETELRLEQRRLDKANDKSNILSDSDTSLIPDIVLKLIWPLWVQQIKTIKTPSTYAGKMDSLPQD